MGRKAERKPYLSQPQRETFQRLQAELLLRTNKILKLVPDLDSISDVHRAPVHTRAALQTALDGQGSIGRGYVQEAGSGLPSTEKQVLDGFLSPISDVFVVVTHEAEGTLLVSTVSNIVFCVRGISSSIKQLLHNQPPPPLLLSTSLLWTPFGGVMYNGFVQFPNAGQEPPPEILERQQVEMQQGVELCEKVQAEGGVVHDPSYRDWIALRVAHEQKTRQIMSAIPSLPTGTRVYTCTHSLYFPGDDKRLQMPMHLPVFANGPCPCGSGQPFSACHENSTRMPAVATNYPWGNYNGGGVEEQLQAFDKVPTCVVQSRQCALPIAQLDGLVEKLDGCKQLHCRSHTEIDHHYLLTGDPPLQMPDTQAPQGGGEVCMMVFGDLTVNHESKELLLSCTTLTRYQDLLQLLHTCGMEAHLAPAALDGAGDGLVPLKPRISAPQTAKCEGCGSISNELKQCSGCGKVQYCSKECQRGNWKTHKNMCKLCK